MSDLQKRIDNFMEVYASKVPPEGVCDFCSEPRPPWTYPTRPFISQVIPTQDGHVVVSTDDRWAACETCHALIEREAWRELAVRSTDMLIAETPPIAVHRSATLAEQIRLQEQFRTSRNGPAFRHREVP